MDTLANSIGIAEQMNKENAKLWVKALRSGKYGQTTGRLQDADGNYCCLGVACELFIPKKDQGRYGVSSKPLNEKLIGSMPGAQRQAPTWLKYVDEDLMIKTGTGFAELNDTSKFSFDEIADIIQAVYVEGVLDEPGNS